MNHPAFFTNGVWELPPHARGVGPREEIRVPAGERSHVLANGDTIVLKNPRHPEDGWKVVRAGV